MATAGANKTGSSLSGSGLYELKARLLCVLIGIMVYRLGAFIPVPGLDPAKLANLFGSHSSGLLGLFNMFSGGAFSRVSIFALGIMPYISSSIIVQMYSSISPELKELQREGESGRRKITQYTRYGTVFLSLIQSFAITSWLISSGVVIDPSIGFKVTAVLTLVTGTMFLMWLGEQMTERGVGNGISLIIFAGIAARMPSAIQELFTQVRQGQMSPLTLLIIVVAVLAITAVVVYFERAQRRITINYAKRMQGRKLYAAQSNHLPLKINMAGVIPPIFAQAILLFPATIARFLGTTHGFGWLQEFSIMLSPGQPLYMLAIAILVIFFSFFYNGLTFNPRETAENLKKSGAFIPGVRPGHQTAKYIEGVMDRLTFVGSIYITVVALLPDFFIMLWHVPFYFGGTSLLIIVVVAMDFIAQVQAHLMSQNYNSMMKGGNGLLNKKSDF
jgi:preprotein translocase subunit SecY